MRYGRADRYEFRRGLLVALHKPTSTYLCLRRGSVLRNIKLIDVRTGQLLPYPSDSCEYITLSYVWGTSIPGRFTLEQTLPQLPQTIEDAMLFCRMLQKRYL